MDFEEILNRAEIEDHEAWRAELLDSHTGMISGANARIDELEAEAAEWKAKYESAAAHNYELLRSVTAEKDAEEHEDEELHATEDELGEEDRKFDDLIEEI